MALLIDIVVRREQTANGTVYSYSVPNREGEGFVLVDRDKSDVHLLAPIPGEADQHFFQRVRRKLMQHAARGQLPERTIWAS